MNSPTGSIATAPERDSSSGFTRGLNRVLLLLGVLGAGSAMIVGCFGKVGTIGTRVWLYISLMTGIVGFLGYSMANLYGKASGKISDRSLTIVALTACGLLLSVVIYSQRVGL